MVAGAIDQRLAGFHGVLHDARHFDLFLLDFDLAAADAGKFEKVINHPHHMNHLPFHCLVQTLRCRAGRMGHSQDVQAVADRRQWIAKLMGQRCQKFIL